MGSDPSIPDQPPKWQSLLTAALFLENGVHFRLINEESKKVKKVADIKDEPLMQGHWYRRTVTKWELDLRQTAKL